MTYPDDRRRAPPASGAERRLQLLMESIPDYAIFILDPTGHIETWNRGAELIHGYKPDEIIGETLDAFYTPEDRAAGKPDRLLAEARERGRTEDAGWRVRKDGARFWGDVVITVIHETDGQVVGFVKVTRDLTERRAAEMDRLQLAHTQEALRLRDEFLSIASHELRTPLGALQLQLDSLRLHGHLEPKQLSRVERASRNVQRLTDLIDTLLDASRIAQGRLTLTPRWVDLGSLVSEVIDRLYEPGQEARCSVVSDLAREIEGRWDPLRIGQVVSNLLANAFKYAAGSQVDVTVARDGDLAVLSVADRGPGIAEEHLDRIFERFQRAAPARNFGGMGLGLYVAREIVVAHGGTIHAANRAGGGAILVVRLPISITAGEAQ